MNRLNEKDCTLLNKQRSITSVGVEFEVHFGRSSNSWLYQDERESQVRKSFHDFLHNS